MDQNKKAMVALLILAGAAFGYWMWSKKSSSDSPVSEGPSADAVGKSLSGYGVPPNIGAQVDATGGTAIMTNGNSLPLPMNGG